MAPRLSVDDRLRTLREIRGRGDLDEIRVAALKLLADRSNLIIAEAAKMIGDFAISGTEPQLLEVAKKLFEHSDPIKVDKGCTAKTAIVETLGRLEYDGPEFYLAAISYRQVEPDWPEAQDTADRVRANAAFALVPSRQLRLVDKLVAFVNLMQGTRNDRLNAVRAIADAGHEMAVPLLRMKLFQGDNDLEVLGTCMAGLLKISSSSSTPFVVSFLKNPDEDIVLEAAVALGTSGTPKAIEALIDRWNRTAAADLKASLLFSIGLSRNSIAIDFLISQLESGNNPKTVLEALRPACVYHETRDRVRGVLERLGDRQQIAEFERRFGHDTDDHAKQNTKP